MRGYQFGIQMRAAEEKSAAIAREAAHQKQYEIDSAALMAQPSATAQDFANLILKYPEKAEARRVAWNMLKEERQLRDKSHE